MLLITFRKFKSFYLQMSRFFLVRKYARSIRKEKGFDGQSAHILIVKKMIYVEMAEICFTSFLNFNRDSQVVIHCDGITFFKTQKSIKRLRLSGRINVLRDMRDDLSWQENKIDLILSLNGTNDFFMDADLRWNGSLPEIQGLTFFVKEFVFIDKSPYRQILHRLVPGGSSTTSMKNTSFFSFSGKNIPVEFLNHVRQKNRDFESLIELCDIGELDRLILNRLCEQIVLSVLVETWEIDIFFLKKFDGHKDGLFVESSYFGATGSTF